MCMKSLFLKIRIVSALLALLVTGSLFFVVHTVLGQSGTPSVFLSVDGGGSVQVVNNSTIVLSWEAYHVTNCSINNGVGAIPNEELPIGSREVIPPASAATTYYMTCQGGATDSVVVNVVPIISLTASPNPVTANANGDATITLTRNVQLATRCTSMTYQTASGATGNVNINASAVAKLTGTDEVDLSETTTYTLTCINEVSGATNSQSVEVVVNGGAAPDPEITQFLANPASGPINATWAGFRTLVRYTAINSTECTRWARDVDGNTIVIPRWTTGTIYAGTGVTWPFYISFAETTDLFIRCGRPVDNKYVEGSIRVTVVTSPPVTPIVPTVNILAPDTAVVEDPASAQVSVSATPQTSGIDFCDFNAYRIDETPMTLTGWTNRHPFAHINQQATFTISQSVILELVCTRVGDGMEVTDTHTITFVGPSEPAPPPTVTLEVVPLVAEQNPETGAGTVHVSWTSQNTTFCSPRQATAHTESGPVTYNLPLSNATSNSGNINIFANTTIRIVCGRLSDSLTAAAQVDVYLSGVGEAVVDTGITVETGMCIDENGIFGAPGAIIDIPEGFIVGLGSVCAGDIQIISDRSLVRPGETVELEWRADPLLTCQLFGLGDTIDIENSATSTGAFTSDPINAERTFTLNCGGGGTVNTTVRVLPRIDES